ncbi:MAG: hypothetical protein JHC95_08230 [Solirubrobacteraceae bacterium]|nr:hypothetical protein [Solirubrobacteraceae bacterium]
MAEESEPGDGEQGEPEEKSKRKLPTLPQLDPEQRKSLISWFTLAAALIAALASVWAVRDARSDRHETAKGTARLMQAEFLSRFCDLSSAQTGRRYPVADLGLDSQLSPADRIKVAARMDPDDWKQVAMAEARLGRAERLLQRRGGDRLTRRDRTRRQASQDKHDAAALRLYIDSFDKAFVALQAEEAADAFPDAKAKTLCAPRERPRS